MRGVALRAELRPGRDEDGAEFIALIGRCWADYPGVILDVDEDEPHLRALATYFAAQGGMLWVAPGTLGMIAAVPRGKRVWELCKVYVHPDLHGSGLAHVLLDAAEAHAAAAGARSLELWTDTRFARAHRFYEKRGYVRRQKRALANRSDSTEWRYVRELADWKGARRPRARRTGLNLDDKQALTIGIVHTFIKQYGRKAQRGAEPNDRRFGRDAERLVKRLRPEVLDELMRDGGPDS